MSSWLLKINRPPHRFKCLPCEEDENYPDCSMKCLETENNTLESTKKPQNTETLGNLSKTNSDTKKEEEKK